MEQKQEPIWMRVRRFIDDEACLSRKQVAINMGRSESYVSLILSGKRRLDVDEYEQLCRAIAVSPMKFFAV